MTISYVPTLDQVLGLANRAMTYDSNDLANSQTPNFHAKTFSFQDQLAAALRQTTGASSSIQGTVATEPGAISPDQSSVDMTGIMVNLTENQTTYDLAAQALQMQQTTLQTVANLSTP